jgi:hypothetical protein
MNGNQNADAAVAIVKEAADRMCQAECSSSDDPSRLMANEQA